MIETQKKEVQKFFRDANMLWCHPPLNPLKRVVITPVNELYDYSDDHTWEEYCDFIAEGVAEVLAKRGIKNLLGSTRDNLKMLVPLFIEQMEK